MNDPPIHPGSRLVGQVAEIWRYPVKSMRGEPLETAELRWTGIAGDRQFAFVRDADRTRFPWLTGRILPELLLHRAAYDDPAALKTSPLTVTAPDGRSFDFWDDALSRSLADQAGEAVRPIRIGRGAFDQHPVSVITAATLVRLAADGPVDPRRFRINIIVAGVPEAPPEADWIGGTVAFGGGAAVRVDEPIERCAMVTIDPDTAWRDPKIMRKVAQDFGNLVGLYTAPVALGQIAVGDPVYLATS